MKYGFYFQLQRPNCLAKTVDLHERFYYMIDLNNMVSFIEGEGTFDSIDDVYIVGRIDNRGAELAEPNARPFYQFWVSFGRLPRLLGTDFERWMWTDNINTNPFNATGPLSESVLEELQRATAAKLTIRDRDRLMAALESHVKLMVAS